MKKTIITLAAVAMLDANGMNAQNVEEIAVPSGAIRLTQVNPSSVADVSPENLKVANVSEVPSSPLAQTEVPAALTNFSFNSVDDINRAGKCWTFVYNALRAGQVVINGASTILTGSVAGQLMNVGDEFDAKTNGEMCIASAIASGLSTLNTFFLHKISGRLEELQKELQAKTQSEPAV